MAYNIPQSLRSFFQTIIWCPDLAVHVEVLDLREWRYTPRLDHYMGQEVAHLCYDDEQKKTEEERRDRRWRKLPREDDSDYDEEQDGDYKD